MKIIDIHTHVYPDAIAAKAASGIRRYYDLGEDMDGTAAMLLDRGRLAGIDKFVLLPVAVRPDQVDSINQFILRKIREEDRFLGFGTVHAAMENIADAAENILRLGLRGIKLHPDCQHFNADDPRLFPMYEAVQGRLPVVIHMGDPRYDYSHPARLRRVLDQFPDLQVLAAHFGGHTMYEEACRQLKDTGCFMDISSTLMFLNPGEAERYIRLYGAERLAFGTDYPVWDPVHEVQRLMKLNITPDELEQIAWKTASHILKL